MWWGWVFSLLDREKTETVIRGFRPQIVMHFAATSLVGVSMVDPGKYYRNNWVVGKRRLGDPAVLVAASEKAARVLGWEPCYRNIEEIVATAWEWHRRHPGGYAERGNTFKGGGRDGN